MTINSCNYRIRRYGKSLKVGKKSLSIYTGNREHRNREQGTPEQGTPEQGTGNS